MELLLEPFGAVLDLNVPLSYDEWEGFGDALALYPLATFTPNDVRYFKFLMSQNYKTCQCLYKVGFHFPYMPKMLNTILHQDFSDSKLKSYVSLFILHSTMAWYCYLDATNDSSDFLLILDCLLSASRLDFREVALSTFVYVAERLLNTNIFKVTVDFAQRMETFYNANLDLPCESTKLLTQSITKLSENHQLQTQLLSMITKLVGERPGMFNKRTADLITNLLFSSAVAESNQSYACLSVILPLATPGGHSAIFRALPKSILELIESTTQPQAWPDEPSEEVFTFESTESNHSELYQFRDKEQQFELDLETEPTFPKPVEYIQICSRHVVDRIRSIIMASAKCPAYIIVFLDSLFENVKQREGSKYLGSFFCYLIYTCKRIVTKISDYALGKRLWDLKLFDPKITIYGNFENCELLNTLRNNALDVIMTECRYFDEFMDNFLEAPLIFTEVMYRLIVKHEQFELMLVKKSDCPECFRKIIINYRNLSSQANVNNKYLRMVANAILKLFTVILQNDDVMTKLMSNQNFLNAFITLFYDESVQNFLLEKTKEFFKRTRPSDCTALVVTMSNLFPTSGPRIEHDSRYADLIIKLVHALGPAEQRYVNVTYAINAAHDMFLSMIKQLELTETSNRVFLAFLEMLMENRDSETIGSYDTDMITIAIGSLYGNKPTQGVYDAVLKLFSGKENATRRNFKISNGILMPVLFHVFINTEFGDDLLDFFTELTKQNHENCAVFHKWEIDILILNLIEELDGVAHIDRISRLLVLFKQVASVESSSLVVKKYSALLVPLKGNVISEKVPVLVRTLYDLVLSDYWKTGISVDVSKGRIGMCEIRNNPGISQGFTLMCWLFVHDDNADAAICEISHETYSLKVVLKDQEITLHQISETGTEVVNTACKVLTDVWTLVMFTMKREENKFVVMTSCNLNYTQNVHISYKDYGSGCTRITIGENRKNVGVVELSRFAITSPISPEQEKRIYYDRPFRVSSENYSDSYFVYYQFDPSALQKANLKRTSFSYSLVVIWKLDLVIPLFRICKYPFQDGTMFEDLYKLALIIYSKSVCYSKLAQERIAAGGNIRAIAYLQTKLDPSKLTFSYYLLFFSMFQCIKSDTLRLDVFKRILVNPEIWMKAPKEERIHILQHWSRVLFPSYSPNYVKARDFSDMMLITSIYLGSSEEGVDLSLERISMNTILLGISELNFSTRDFYSIVSQCEDGNDIHYVENLMTLMSSIFHSIPHKLKEIGLSAGDMSLLHKLFAIDNDLVKRNIIEIIIQVHRESILEKESLVEHLDVLMSTAGDLSFTPGFIQHMLNLLNIGNPELFGFCCWIACKDSSATERIYDYFLTDFNRRLEIEVNQFWYLWLMIGIIVCDITDEKRQELIAFAIDISKKNWRILIPAAEIIGKIMDVDADEFKSKILYELGKEILPNGSFASTNRYDFLIECFNFLFLRPANTMSKRLKALFSEAGIRLRTVSRKRRRTSEVRRVHHDDIYGRISQLEAKKVTRKCFGLRIDAEGTWVDLELAVTSLILIEKFVMSELQEQSKLLFLTLGKLDQSYLVSYLPAAKQICDYDDEFLHVIENTCKSPEVVLHTWTKAISSLYDKKQMDVTTDDLIKIMSNYIQSFVNRLSSRFSKSEGAKQKIKDDLWNRKFHINNDINIVKESWDTLWSALRMKGGPWHNKHMEGIKSVKLSKSSCWCMCNFKVKYGKPNHERNRRYSRRNYESKHQPYFEAEIELITARRKQSGKLRIRKDATSVDLLLQAEQSWKYKSFLLGDVRHIFMRTRFHRYTAIEIFTVTGASYFINFLKQSTATNAMNKILELTQKSIWSVQQYPMAQYFASLPYKHDWLSGKMSNFEYLMRLNIVSGRSFNDASKYPMFPWILVDYESEVLDLSNIAVFRDLTKPIGAINPVKLQILKEMYRDAKRDKEASAEAAIFTSGPVSAMAVCHWLVRLEPFTSLHKEFQGQKFDVASRLFSSINKSFRLVISQYSSESWELIPEFFFMPEFLRNGNNLDMGLEGNGDVELPKWAKSPIDFIYKHRKALESDYVSQNLHHWINLVWGYQQCDEEADNVYPASLYETIWNTQQKRSELEICEIQTKLTYCGELPPQILRDPHPEKTIHVTEPAISKLTVVALDERVLYTVCHANSATEVTFYSLLSNGVIIAISNDFDVEQGSAVEHTRCKLSDELVAVLADPHMKLTPAGNYRGNAMIIVTLDSKMFSINMTTGKVVHSTLHLSAPPVCVSATDEWYAVACQDSTTDIYELSDRRASDKILLPRVIIRSYSGLISACCVAYLFKIYICASKEGTLMIYSINKGEILNVISLPGEPKRIITTPTWGFIIVEVCLTEKGVNSTILQVYTVNGEFIRETKIDSPIHTWYVWASHKGFDYIAYVTEQYRSRVYISEVYYMNPINIPVLGFKGTISSIAYERESKMFYFQSPETVNRILLYPFDCDTKIQ